MKQKEQYTLQELYDNLPITLTELSKLTGKSHGTLARIRDGEPTRRSTINKLLIILSGIYKVELSLDNVTGIVLEGRQQRGTVETLEPSVSASMGKDTSPTISSPQKRATATRGKKEKLPDGWIEGSILSKHFAINHSVSSGTFYGHMMEGLGPGLIGEKTDMIPERDRVKHEAPESHNRKGERTLFLTPEQQKGAIEFWIRQKDRLLTRKVRPQPCSNPDCPCHILKLGEHFADTSTD